MTHRTRQVRGGSEVKDFVLSGNVEFPWTTHESLVSRDPRVTSLKVGAGRSSTISFDRELAKGFLASKEDLTGNV